MALSRWATPKRTKAICFFSPITSTKRWTPRGNSCREKRSVGCGGRTRTRRRPFPDFPSTKRKRSKRRPRSAFRSAAGPDMTKERYRRLLIDSIAHHEGFHKHYEPRLAEAARRGRIDEERKAILHEAGAYLYQLETSDPAFVPMNLMMVLATGANPGLPQGPNAEGCRLLLAHLQRYVRDARFWNSDEQMPIGPGLAELFRHAPADIQKAAGQARWDLDVELDAQ